MLSSLWILACWEVATNFLSAVKECRSAFGPAAAEREAAYQVKSTVYRAGQRCYELLVLISISTSESLITTLTT